MGNVIWNNFVPEVNADNYAPYNPSNVSASFDGDVCTMTWLKDGGSGASYAIRPNDYWQWEVGHISYFSYEINPSFDGAQWSVEFGGGYIPSSVICPANTWTRLSFIGKNPQSSTGNKRFYIPNRRGGTAAKTGDTCKFRNPVFINLTTMFGAGNEPLDVEYFEYLCALNGVDVTKAQTYEPNGVSKIWRLGKLDQSLFSARRRILITTPHVETASGSIANFKTDMSAKLKECKVYFSPVQEGTGDPSPSNVRPISGWDGFAIKKIGKNLYDISSYPLTNGIWIHGGAGHTAENNSYASTDYIPFKGYDGQTITLNKRPGGANPGIAFYNYSKRYINGVSNSQGTAGTPMTAAVPLGTEYMRFTVPANATDVQIEIGSSSTNYEPYIEEDINITIPPIGNNLLNINTIESEKYLKSNGNTDSASSWYLTDYIPANEITSYIIQGSVVTGTPTAQHGFYDANKDLISTIHAANFTFTTPQECKYVRLSLKGNLASDFQFHSNTVYGGYIDLLNGILVITMKSAILDDSDYWNDAGAYNGHRFSSKYDSSNPIPDAAYGDGGNDIVACSNLKPAPNGKSARTEYGTNIITIGSYQPQVFVAVDFAITITDFKEWLSDNPIQIIYNLATPLVYQLTPKWIKTIKGNNNIWSDVNGNIEIKFWTH